MNARLVLISLILIAVILSGCAPAATTQAPIAVQPKATHDNQPQAAPTQAYRPLPTQTAPQMPVPTAPPAATYAPMPSNPSVPYAPAPVPQDNFFQDYGINGFVDARRDHLSTFAVDVDTASYTVARRYVQDGSLPPQDAVRVEEFINYFDPGYNPPADAAFAIYADGAPSPFHSDGTTLLRIGIQGYRVPDWKRKPAALTFVIDVSGSMNMENRLGLVKQSLDMLVDRLRPTDTVGIVVYGTDARVVLDPTQVSNRNQILWGIDSLRTEGATNAEAGLRLGFQLAINGFRPDANNRVILCSDGVANVGNINPDTILEFVHGYISEGVSLSTFGFGMGNFNDALLERLADKGNGMYAYVDTLDEAQRLFVDNLSSTLTTIAKDAKVQVDFNSDVVAGYRLIGYENRAVADQNFRNDSVDAGEIGAGHHVVAMYAVQFKPGAQGRIATVQLRWADPQTSRVTEINGNLNTWGLSPTFDQASPYFKLDAVVAQYAEILRGSPYAGNTSLYYLSELASWLRASIPEDSDVDEFAGLVHRAAAIAQ